MCLFCTINAVTKEFRIYNQKWGVNDDLGTGGGTVSYSFANQNFSDQFGSFDSFIQNKSYQDEITSSFAAWEDVANIRFILSPDSRGVDIRLGWREIDGKGGVLGQTTVPASGKLSNVIVALDVEEDWFVFGDAPRNQIDFSSTATHEIGHAIGIDHSETTQSLMNASYSADIFELQQDDIDAAISIYGRNEIVKVEVHRFFNPTAGGHFFTADNVEKVSVEQHTGFITEGVGFEAISSLNQDADGSVPVYRFFNKKLGSHFFTAFEIEKDVVMDLVDFTFEGVGFRAFGQESASTQPIYRFFNRETGGHFFTGSENEKNIILNLPSLSYEGEAFFAFV